MTTRLPGDLLSRSAEEASRLVLLAYLDEAGRAQHRLTDPLDSEGLHDFRVALRRLRSCTRAYRPQLKGSVSKRMRRRLRDLTRATNPGRDTEVQLAWLHQQAAQLGPGDTQGLAWLVGRLEGRKFEALDAVTTEVASRFTKVATRLRPRLQTFRVEVRTGKGQDRPSFGQVTGGLILTQGGRLAEKLHAVRKADDVAEAHVARIAAKRLRYLLEPLSRRVAGVKSQVQRLKELQDLLGQLRDRHVLVGEIAASLAGLARNKSGRPSGPEPGLMTLQHLTGEDAGALFASFQDRWADGVATRFFHRTDELGRNLAHPDARTAAPPEQLAAPTDHSADPVVAEEKPVPTERRLLVRQGGS
jgi:CHAD domain-containing protein